MAASVRKKADLSTPMRTRYIPPMVIYSELEKRIARAGSLRKLALEWGLSAAYLSEVRLKKKPVGDTILSHLGFEKRVTYRRTNGQA